MEFENNIPIYIQVINQIKKDIITGKLPMGAKLPSTRELAVLYHINPNTAGRVYKEMELQNMCYTKRGLGTFVTEDAAVFKSMREEMAQEFIKMGYYIGVGGVVTFKNAKKLKETVEAIPLERILLETDCPYMTPEPHRGTRNDSSNIPFVIAKIAELKGITAEEVERVTEENAGRLFTKVS